MKTSSYFLLVILCTTTLLSCEPAGQIKQMFDFRNAIQDKYHCSDVSIQITNDSLAVSVVNSPYEDSSNTIKLQLAKEIGTMSKQYIKSAVTAGTLSFKNEHNYVVVNTANISNFPMFPEKH